VASQGKGSSVAQLIISSGSTALIEGTPASSVVEGTNDQLRNEGIQTSPEDLEDARRGIVALRAVDQELLRSSATPGNRAGHQRQGRCQRTRKQC
jgi:hypothetical protein